MQISLQEVGAVNKLISNKGTIVKKNSWI